MYSESKDVVVNDGAIKNITMFKTFGTLRDMNEVFDISNEAGLIDNGWRYGVDPESSHVFLTCSNYRNTGLDICVVFYGDGLYTITASSVQNYIGERKLISMGFDTHSIADSSTKNRTVITSIDNMISVFEK